MRYAIISDLHGNRQALKAVLTDIRSIGVDRLICLGDCVGYGPSPAEVLETAYANVHHFVLGNHDAVIAGRLDPDCFNDNARKIIDWTCGALDGASADFFNGLPLVVYDDGFCCTHGEFSSPGAFNYIFEPEEALPSFTASCEQLLVVGHSHVPALVVLGDSGVPHWLEPRDFGLENGKHYLVNAGSVGQPRDRDVRASYVVFDLAAGDVFFRKVPFDLDAYREDLRRRQVPEDASYFLSFDSSRQGEPLREMVNFRPAKNYEFVAGDNDVRTLETSLRKLKKKNRRLVALSTSLAGLSLVFIWLAANWRPLDADSSLLIPAAVETITVDGARAGDVLLAMPFVSCPDGGAWEIAVDRPLRHWSVTVSDPETQKVFLEKREGEVHFRLFSDDSDRKITITSSSIPLLRGQRMQVRATFFNENVEHGFAEIYGQYQAPDGTLRRLDASTIHNLEELSRWSPRAATCEELRDDGLVRYVLQAQFKGELRVRDCSMILR